MAWAFAQTHTSIEVVVVGDRCDAATEAAVRSVDDPRVRFENLAERGRYPADPQFRWMVAGSTPMNRALDLARGDWIAPLDDQDRLGHQVMSKPSSMRVGLATWSWPVGGRDRRSSRVSGRQSEARRCGTVTSSMRP